MLNTQIFYTAILPAEKLEEFVQCRQLGIHRFRAKLFRLKALLPASAGRLIQRFFAQPTTVAEKFTGIPGVYVPLKDTLESFEKLVNGELDEYPGAAFYNVGTWRDVVEKAKKIEAGEA